MIRKYLALVLAAVLMVAAVPAVQAAETDSLVLHGEMNDYKNVIHYYRADGTLARTDWVGCDRSRYTLYSYIGYSLIQEDKYEDNKLYERTIYDLYGTEIESFFYDEDGKSQDTGCVSPPMMSWVVSSTGVSGMRMTPTAVLQAFVMNTGRYPQYS